MLFWKDELHLLWWSCNCSCLCQSGRLGCTRTELSIAIKLGSGALANVDV